MQTTPPAATNLVNPVSEPDPQTPAAAPAGAAAQAQMPAAPTATAAPLAGELIDQTIEGPVFETEGLSVHYAGKPAVLDVTVKIAAREITAFIGPSGCGKSTILRCFDRMNDLIPGAVVGGSIRYHGLDLYGRDIDPVQVRKRIGMVFQKPNPFPKSVYDNVAFGPRVLGMAGDMGEIVETALRRASLWDDVKDRLKDNAFGMSGGYKAAIDPAAFTVREGKLYFNYNREVQNQWSADIPGHVSKADRNWPAVAKQTKVIE